MDAVPRRMLGLLRSMYVDDGGLIDLRSARGRGQVLVNKFFQKLGCPLSLAKHQPMAAKADFLGIAHDLGSLAADGDVVFWLPNHIVEEMESTLAMFRSAGKCTPGEASKFRGVYGFAASAEFGQPGKAPVRPFKQRQCWDSAPWTLSNSMYRSIEMVELYGACRCARGGTPHR